MTSALQENLTPGKILLAGEYTVLNGGDAFAMPLDHFYGQWQFTPNLIDQRLKELQVHLGDLTFLDHEKFNYDLLKGLRFESNIPQGYGLGSSGALTAAILKQYAIDKVTDLVIMQERLAAIEQYYHGTSSGFDPLISYTRQATILRQSHIVPVDLMIMPGHSSILQHFYLINSNTTRGTSSPIEWYYAQQDNSMFQAGILQMEILNRDLIQAMVLEKFTDFIPLIKKLSQLQSRIFKPLIVPKIYDLWMEGLRSDTYYLKLCGKGGGGYYLAWSSMQLPPAITASWIPVF